MRLDEILTKAGHRKAHKRLGRGIGSGQGKTGGRGTKGGGARAGWGARLGKEGGQNTVFARMPKRGFNNFNFRTDYQVVNVSDLEKLEAGTRVDAEVLAKAKMISDVTAPVKILGNGNLSKKLTVVAQKFSASAAEKIAQAGGTVEQPQA